MQHFTAVFALVAVALMLGSVAAQNTYAASMEGACRGNGGANDKINSRMKGSTTDAECRAACDAESSCVGYSHCERSHPAFTRRIRLPCT